MSFWLDFLPIIIYILLIIILIVGIILGVKSFIMLDKVDKIIDDVEKKVKSVSGLFKIVDIATDKIVGISEKITELIGNLTKKLFMKKNKREEDDIDG